MELLAASFTTSMAGAQVRAPVMALEQQGWVHFEHPDTEQVAYQHRQGGHQHAGEAGTTIPTSLR